jgi:hypothetical protein
LVLTTKRLHVGQRISRRIFFGCSGDRCRGQLASTVWELFIHLLIKAQLLPTEVGSSA